MNIIEAREAAFAGKTVISPTGVEMTSSSFDHNPWSSKCVFGEWKVKREPREIWVNEYQYLGPGPAFIVYLSKKDADAASTPHRTSVVKFVEVMDE